LLIGKGLEVHAVVRKRKLKNIAQLKNKIKIYVCDIRNKKKLATVVKKSRPDYVFHLAAQSFVMPSWKDPKATFDTNITGTFYLLDAIKKTGIDPVIVVACSSAEYGLNYKNEIPIKETKEFRPTSPYATSKVSTDMISYLYSQAYDMKIIRARIFNTIGPRKTGSAVADFATMMSEVESGKRKSIEVGNLDGVVDFTDVRDNVNALWMLAKNGKYGEAYNVCSGKGYKINDILEKLLSHSNKKINVVISKKKLRPFDDPIFIGDNSKMKSIGWSPKIGIDKTLKDTLDYWRNKK
jgi:GDP-4-dehydro-6-deoxy-D-mannose reductase